MRLAVIGDTQHYRDADGSLCALEPVVNQLDRWAELFDEVVLCAPLSDGPPPKGFARYRSPKFRIEPIPQGGGNDLRSKVAMLRLIVPWARATRRVARSVDAVHLRCPCNVGLVAIVSTWRAVPHRYAMYAGVWHDYVGEPRFFRLQRKLLGSRWFGGPVSVYGDRNLRRPHLEPFFSPSFSLADWRAAEPTAAATVARIGDPRHDGPWQLVTVGRLTPNKNQETIVRALPAMVAKGLDVQLSVIGDGPCRGRLESVASELGVGPRVTFHGSLDHGEVMSAFAAADLNLLSTRQEGYGKVLLEGMVHATVPVLAESPAAAEISGSGSRGVVFPADDPEQLAREVVDLVGDRARWARMAEAGRSYAATVTLEAFQERVHDMLERQWGVDLPEPPSAEDVR
jgi:glycosyltransferase involved in cell wall biosynthesis